MGDYSNMDGGNVTIGKSRLGPPRIQAWDTTYNGFESDGDGRSKLSFGTKGPRDHVCRPVIVDADGRTRPAFMVLAPRHHNGDNIVTKTETVVEYVSPTSPASAHTNGSTTKQAMKDQIVSNEGLGSPSQDRTPKIKEYTGRDQTAGFTTKQAVTDYTVSNTGLGRPGIPFQDQTSKTKEYTGKQAVTDYTVSNTGLGRPGIPFQDQTPKTKEYAGSNQTASRNYPWSRATGNTTTTQEVNFGGARMRNESVIDSVNAATAVNKDRWIRSGRFGWRTPIYQENSLSTPTNDIGRAIDYVRESTRLPYVPTAPPQSRFSAPPLTLPANLGTIDSKAVAQTYNSRFM